MHKEILEKKYNSSLKLFESGKLDLPDKFDLHLISQIVDYLYMEEITHLQLKQIAYKNKML